MILAGDLGGTKTLLALAEPGPDGPRIVREERFASGDFAVFSDLLTRFLDPVRQPLHAACFGLAGPTDGRTAKLTYLPWQLDSAELQERFGIGRVVLANDFAAAAGGLALLSPTQLLRLQPGSPKIHAPQVIVGAGTGLGVAGLLWSAGAYRVVPGEGGHQGFAPQSAQEAALWAWLFARRGRVTAEDVISGAGLSRVHEFLSGEVKEAAVISAGAIAGNDAQALAAVELWLGAYGSLAGDVALSWLACGGVFIAGGIAAKLLPNYPADSFLRAFNAKREHAALARRMPVQVVIEERLGLLGALAMAADIAASPGQQASP